MTKREIDEVLKLASDITAHEAQKKFHNDEANHLREKLYALVGVGDETKVPAKKTKAKKAKPPAKKRLVKLTAGQKDGTSAKVFEYFKRRPNHVMRPADIAKAFSFPLSKANRTLGHLVRYERLVRVGEARYQIAKGLGTKRTEPTGLRLNAIEVVESEKKPIHSAEVAKRLNANPKQVDQLMRRAAEKGVIMKVGPSTFKHMNGHNRAEAN